jgi:hypothetical protein
MAKVGRSIEEIVLLRQLNGTAPRSADVLPSSRSSSNSGRKKKPKAEEGVDNNKKLIQSLMEHCQTLSQKVQVLINNILISVNS